MVFWGVVVSPLNAYIHRARDHTNRLRITQASLGVTDISNEKRIVVLCTLRKEHQFSLCVLIPKIAESQSLNLELDPDEDVRISVNGRTPVSLTGYYLNGCDRLVINKDSSDSDAIGEDIQQSDTEGSSDCEEDDYDYDDDFIVDDRDFEDDGNCPKSKLKNLNFGKKETPRARSCHEKEVNSSKHQKIINSPVKPIKKPKYEGKRLTPAFDI